MPNPFRVYVLLRLLTQGCRLRSNPGLELANAFGVMAPTFCAYAFGVMAPTFFASGFQRY
jgi:hypothetical protein